MDCAVIRIRYKDFSAGTHDVAGLQGRTERCGRAVTVYLLPGLAGWQRSAVIRRLRQEASRGTRPAAAAAAAGDRARPRPGTDGGQDRQGDGPAASGGDPGARRLRRGHDDAVRRRLGRPARHHAGQPGRARGRRRRQRRPRPGRECRAGPRADDPGNGRRGHRRHRSRRYWSRRQLGPAEQGLAQRSAFWSSRLTGSSRRGSRRLAPRSGKVPGTTARGRCPAARRGHVTLSLPATARRCERYPIPPTSRARWTLPGKGRRRRRRSASRTRASLPRTRRFPRRPRCGPARRAG